MALTTATERNGNTGSRVPDGKLVLYRVRYGDWPGYLASDGLAGLGAAGRGGRLEQTDLHDGRLQLQAGGGSSWRG